MSRGSLKCCGSPLYLKSKYGSGYNLVLTRKRTTRTVDNEEKENMVINNHSDPGAMTSESDLLVESSHDQSTDNEAYTQLREAETRKIIDLIETEIPSAVLNSNINSELSFMLPSDQSSRFADLFEKLESKSEELNILNIGVSVTTVEEVFLK